jgi:ABC-type nitrate/sulfonate/bicarbonate transport system permease component
VTARAAGADRPGLVGDVRGALGGIGLRVSVLAGLLVIWQLAAIFADSPFFPTFTDTAGRLWDAWLSNVDALTGHFLPSLARLLGGWVLAVAVGVGTGTLIGLSARLRDYIDPIIQFARAIPPPALLPLFIVLLGIDDVMKVAMIAFGVIWPIILNTADGVRSVEQLHRDTARAYHVTFTDELVRVILPSAAPKIFAGLRVSLAIAVILMVISEMYASVNGVGFTIVQAQRNFQYLNVWAGILFLGMLGYLLNTVLTIVEGFVLSWQHGAMKVRGA